MDFNKLIIQTKDNLSKIKELCSDLLSKSVSRVRSLFQKNQSSETTTANNEPRTANQKVDASTREGKRWLTMGLCISWLKKLGKPLSNLLFRLETRFLHSFPEKQRRPVLLGIGGLTLLFIFLLISIPVTLSGRTRQTAPARVASGFIIPSDELFIPSEPDVLPYFIIEREPRGFWILEDLRPYWRAPENTDLWREQISSAVDRLMEGVP